MAGFAAAASVLPLSLVSTSTSTESGSSSGLYALDSFTRTVSNGWGRADTGGGVVTGKGSASDLSVHGSSGVFSIPGANYLNAEQIVTLPRTSAFDYVGSFVVGFSENINNYNPQHGGVVAYLVARYQARSSTGYYRLGLVWEASDRRLWLRSQNAAGAGQPNDFTIQKDTGIDPTRDYSSPPYAYNVKVEITGSKPTSFASKVWKHGTPGPSGWMLTGTDTKKLGPQAAGPIGLRGSNDLYTGTSSFLSYTEHCTCARSRWARSERFPRLSPRRRALHLPRTGTSSRPRARHRGVSAPGGSSPTAPSRRSACTGRGTPARHHARGNGHTRARVAAAGEAVGGHARSAHPRGRAGLGPEPSGLCVNGTAGQCSP